MPDDYASKYLTPVLKRFAPRHGGVEIQLDCEQSTALIPRVARGDLDLALVSRDHARRGTLLFHEPMVWVGSPQFEVWKRNPLPIAVYEAASLGRRSALNALAVQGRPDRGQLTLLGCVGHLGGDRVATGMCGTHGQSSLMRCR